MLSKWATFEDLVDDARTRGYQVIEDLDYPSGYVIKQVRVGVTHMELKCRNEEVVEAFFIGYAHGHEDA